MGGVVSGTSNSELVDNLCKEKYIVRPEVENVFRMVDRADYMIFQNEDERLEAYEDRAWRKGTVHLSAPCIYSKVMEAMRLEKGMSFLNVGSGTGYLSTMAGLLLGPHGVNHGVEIHPENVEYARGKLAEFMAKSEWYNPDTFCDPVFSVGNGLLMSPDVQYDRVYCGADCPSENVHLVKNLLKLGGILVLAHEGKLESMCRVAKKEWTCKILLPGVFFAPLVIPSNDELLSVVEFVVEPHSLKQLCRLAILHYMERPRYSLISSLPLPNHLKEYVAHYREWGPPQIPFCLQCNDKERESQEEDSDNDFSIDIMSNKIILCDLRGAIHRIPLTANGASLEGKGAGPSNGHEHDELVLAAEESDDEYDPHMDLATLPMDTDQSDLLTSSNHDNTDDPTGQC